MDGGCGPVFELGNSLWAVHAVQGSGANSAIRWDEIEETSNTVLQTGLIDDTSRDFHEPSVAANSLGNVVIGYTCSGPTLAPSACVSIGESVLDVTTFDPPTVLRTGAGHYWRDFDNAPNSERNRWGDYSATVIDPVDPCTFWTFQEFVALSAVGDVGPSVCSNNSALQCSNSAVCGAGNTCNALPEGGEWGVQVTEITFDSCADADLSITKGDAPDPVIAGTGLVYTLTVSNNGPSRARDVVVTDTLPAGVQFVSAGGVNWMCAEVAGVVTCTWQGGNPVGSLAEGQSANAITVTVTVDPSTLGPIVNTGAVTSQTADSVPANDTAPIDTTVIAQADLEITKGAIPDPAVAGSVLKFVVTVHNNGPSDAQNAVFTENLPPQTKFFTLVAPPGWVCVTPAYLQPGTVTCTIPVFPFDATAQFELNVVVDASVANGTVINNTVAVTSDTTDPVSGNDSDMDSAQAFRAMPALGDLGMWLAIAVLLVVAWSALARSRPLADPGRR